MGIVMICASCMMLGAGIGIMVAAFVAAYQRKHEVKRNDPAKGRTRSSRKRAEAAAEEVFHGWE